MAQFDFVVDTTPMAKSVDGVSRHVTETTAAITAMMTAVVKAENDAAEEISNNVDKGFFSLMRTQLSMKSAQHLTEMNAKVALLMEYAKALGANKRRMENDFNRIKREYYKLFHSLDKALENRIAQLDKPAMKIAAVRDDIILKKAVRGVPETVSVISDIPNVEMMALSARLRNKTSRALAALGKKVQEDDEYKNQMGTLLDTSRISESSEAYIPVIYTLEQSMVTKDNYISQLYFSDELSDKVKQAISSSVLDSMSDISENVIPEGEQEEISREFHNLLSKSGMDQRTVEMVMNLYRKNNGGSL